MLIVWGKKVVYQRLGCAADFCFICRVPRVFSIRRLGMAGHLYYITVGKGEIVGFDRTCQVCKSSFPADPDIYKSLQKKTTSLDALVRETFPNLQAVWADRLALEQKVKQATAQLPANERRALILEPFAVLSPKVEARFNSRLANTHLDKEVGFAAIGAIAMLVVLPPMLATAGHMDEGLATLIALTLGVVLLAWQFMVSGQRYLRREVLPALGTALQGTSRNPL